MKMKMNETKKKKTELVWLNEFFFLFFGKLNARKSANFWNQMNGQKRETELNQINQASRNTKYFERMKKMKKKFK